MIHLKRQIDYIEFNKRKLLHLIRFRKIKKSFSVLKVWSKNQETQQTKWIHLTQKIKDMLLWEIWLRISKRKLIKKTSWKWMNPLKTYRIFQIFRKLLKLKKITRFHFNQIYLKLQEDLTLQGRWLKIKNFSMINYHK